MKDVFKKILKKDNVTVKKYKPLFVTVDNIKHEGFEYNWAIVDRLRCSVPEYIMIDIKSDGYIEDKNGIMYPLSNIISIEWKVLKEMVVEDNFDEFKIFLTTKELEEHIKAEF